jgi:outer membrane protein OmpA-like peptidoglycan-associated protein
MQKLGLALIQIVAAFVIANATACATAQPTAQEPVAGISAEEALARRLRALEAKGPLRFETDTDVLDAQARSVLREVKDELFAHPRTKVVISGHADERGDTSYNLALGERRAEAAREFLVRLGVPRGRIRTVSRGEESPLLDGHDESAWAQNRRDEFTFVSGRLATVDVDAPLMAQVVLGE